MIVWINGAFGAGKSITAELIQRACPRTRLWDPEKVGEMLRTVVSDITVRDFQDWSCWREVVVATGHAVASQTGQDLVAPQTIVCQDYLQQITQGFQARSVPLFHVLLDAPTETLRNRIHGDVDKPASEWRLERLDDYASARSWLRESADLVVDTAALSPELVAELIIDAAGLQRSPHAG
jgi:chloramphenicol 3-O-phosphotransferase